jgi:heat shock protein HtpX
MKYISRAFHDFIRFADRNPEYLLCSLIYYLAAVWLFGWISWMVRIILALVYIFSLMVAFSPLGEGLLRLFSYVRRLETAQEKDYLQPLFDEVLENAKAKNPEYDNYHIDLYIKDTMTVNAFAIGKHTIVITKGAMMTFSEGELRAVLAHEVAHILNMDTVAQIYVLVGNGIFSFVILPIKLLSWVIRKAFFPRSAESFADTILGVIIFIFTFLMQIPLAARSRKAEKRADNYTITLGYGEDMVKALYLLEKISLGGEGLLIEKLLASHPRVTSRIEILEIQLGIQQNRENNIDKDRYSDYSLGAIFDELDGKTYGESWDILKLCSDEVVESVAMNCPHDNAQMAAQAIYDEVKPKKKRRIAPLIIFVVILLALAAFSASNLIPNIRDWFGNYVSKVASNVVYRNGVCYITLDPTETIPWASDSLMKPVLEGAEFKIYPLSRNFDNDAEKAANRFRLSTSRKIGIIYNILEDRWGYNVNENGSVSFANNILTSLSILVPPNSDGTYPSDEEVDELFLNQKEALFLFAKGNNPPLGVYSGIAICAESPSATDAK